MRPDFIIIGAMKSATSTLHEQLARQPGFFMTTPKEPNYFSDDDIYARGPQWYASLFEGSESAQLRGESSTHYTKLPEHPHACERMKQALPQVKLIYVMRHPVERLISHYLHQRAKLVIDEPLSDALVNFPELIAFGQYTMQLQPYFDAYGKDAILPVFMPRLKHHAQAELERICTFLGYEGKPEVADLPAQNVAAERLQLGPLVKFVVEQPALATLRRNLVPQVVRDVIKARFRSDERPTLTPSERMLLEALYNEDLARLGALLGVELDCANFDALTAAQSLDWVR